MRTGKVILCRNIHLDKDYKNVLSYSEQKMLALCESKAYKTFNNCSFIRDDNTLIIQVTYGEALLCNYIAFQNPDYSNKWFFAFIDDVKYNSENTTEIHFTVDAWSTWFDEWTPEQCFVIREHVSNDAIGVHTLPENVEVGDRISVNALYKKFQFTSAYIIVGVSDVKDKNTYLTGSVYDGNYSGLLYYAFENNITGIGELNKFIESYDSAGKGDAIYTIFYAPKFLVELNEDNSVKQSLGVKEAELGAGGVFNWEKNLHGYVPKNNKCLTYPYRYLMVSNGAGSAINYQYELFTNNEAKFKAVGCLSQGCSIKLIPQNYKGLLENHNESLVLGKYPTCSWISDTYTNWITQNAVNAGVSYAGSAVNLVGNVLKADVGGAVNSLMSPINSLAQVYQHSLIPGAIKGNISGGDVNNVLDMNSFQFYDMSIKAEYAVILDDFFTKYGYKVNRLKVPNISTRPVLNYLQIGAGEDIGFGTVPKMYMEIINNIARAGVTIWHNHNNIGNYDLNNK